MDNLQRGAICRTCLTQKFGNKAARLDRKVGHAVIGVEPEGPGHIVLPLRAARTPDSEWLDSRGAVPTMQFGEGQLVHSVQCPVPSAQCPVSVPPVQRTENGDCCLRSRLSLSRQCVCAGCQRQQRG